MNRLPIDHQAKTHGGRSSMRMSLTGRIRQLVDRYATPLPALGDEAEVLVGRVDEHLKAMGFA